MSPARFPREMVFRAGSVPILSDHHVLQGDLEPHDHAFREIAVVLSGRGTHHTIHGEGELRRGHVVLLRPADWHAYARCQSLEVQNCLFGEEIATNELAWMTSHPELAFLLGETAATGGLGGPVVLELPEKGLGRCLAALEPLSKFAQAGGSHARGVLVGHLILFLAELSRHLGAEQLSAANRSAAAHPSVRRAIALFREDPAHAWSIEELCSSLHGIDPSYFSRQFRRATGHPPLAWLARHRAGVAAALLLRSGQRVSEIGGLVGWPDPNHFARRFREAFGESPSEYRKRRSSIRGEGLDRAE